mgnify:CR=1 FL=1|jgi:hypothetical protein
MIETKSLAWKAGYKAAEYAKTVRDNPFKGKIDRAEFREGFYEWLKMAQK